MLNTNSNSHNLMTATASWRNGDGDGAAAHFVGTRLSEIVSSRPKARAMRVELRKGAVVETPIRVRYLGAGK